MSVWNNRWSYNFFLREQVGFAAVLWRLRQCVSCLFIYTVVKIHTLHNDPFIKIKIMVDTWYRYIYFLTENPNTQYLLICGVLQHKKFRFRYQYWEKFADITGSDQFLFIIQSWTCWIIVCEKIRTLILSKGNLFSVLLNFWTTCT